MSAEQGTDIRFPQSFHLERLIGNDASTLLADIKAAIENHPDKKQEVRIGENVTEIYLYNTARLTLIEDPIRHTAHLTFREPHRENHSEFVTTIVWTQEDPHPKLPAWLPVHKKETVARANQKVKNHQYGSESPAKTIVDIRTVGKTILTDLSR